MRTPLHLWFVGVLALVWYGFGALDYVLTQTANPDYVANMPEGMLAHIQAYPRWVDAVWALAVWLPVAGALLMLVKSRLAATLFGLDIPLIVAAGVYNYLLASPPLQAIAGNGIIVFWAVVLVIAIGLWLYARTQAQRGVLE
ncbi:hypothetical protein [Oceanibium sediminis]|uniref:hypothetical protein n=1 Tax=Oceanibium sediminis TaxID=2026339 RepID=UPI000DD35692|nr:hypothetical protein [Oceanibium sediminis]